MVLADDLFRVAHDDASGRLRLTGPAVGLGLAAGLVAELLLERRVTVTDGAVWVRDARPPRDPLARVVHGRVVGARGRAVRWWLAELAATAYQDVGGRLLASGHVRVRPPRRRLGLRGTGPVFVPVDAGDFFGPQARLTVALRSGDRLSAEQGSLLALAHAAGLGRHVLDGVPDPGPASGRIQATWWPDLHRLAAELRAAVGRSVTVHLVQPGGPPTGPHPYSFYSF